MGARGQGLGAGNRIWGREAEGRITQTPVFFKDFGQKDSYCFGQILIAQLLLVYNVSLFY